MKRSMFKNRYIFILDILCIAFACLITYYTIFTDTKMSFNSIGATFLIYSASVIAVYFYAGVYHVAWNYSGSTEIIRFIAVNVIAAILMLILNELAHIFELVILVYRRVNIVIALLASFMMTIVRLIFKEAYRTFEFKNKSEAIINADNQERVLIIGAGDAASIIIKNLRSYINGRYYIVGLIDDDRSKQNKIIYDYKVLGGRNDIIWVCEQYNVNKIILAIPTAYVDDRSQILEICNKTKCPVKTMPTVSEILEAPDNVNILRNVQIEDLLARDPIKLDNNGISTLVNGKIIMVTGGGGSIGSELCRQIMRFSPKQLIILDIYENNAYDIQMELNEKYPENKPVVLIASIRDRERLDEIFKQYQPDILFHAAAHKHVPLMEDSPREAVKNNVFGTYNLVCTADKYHLQKFVMISTDKAVNPTNIMGATKRMCEMIIQCMQNISQTEFVAVRFGNVLGSNGSVIPLFKRQIEKGGPVTVTHKDVTRFFMTIPEAAQLVIQAAVYARGGEIFVLDMGKPVRIYDLAKNLIRLSGYTPNVDMDIEVVGLRSGEKIYEELLMDQEGLEKTAHSKIFIGHPMKIEPKELDKKLSLLRDALTSEDDGKLRQAMELAVPTYVIDNKKFNAEARKANL